MIVKWQISGWRIPVINNKKYVPNFFLRYWNLPSYQYLSSKLPARRRKIIVNAPVSSNLMETTWSYVRNIEKMMVKWHISDWRVPVNNIKYVPNFFLRYRNLPSNQYLSSKLPAPPRKMIVNAPVSSNLMETTRSYVQNIEKMMVKWQLSGWRIPSIH